MIDRYQLTVGWKYFFKHLFCLLYHPIFIVLTILVNSLVLIMAALFYWAEKATNGQVDSFLDAIWWSVSTITTVGYGDIVPETLEGRIVGIILIISGTAVFLAYIALFSGVMIGPASKDVQDETAKKHKKLNKTQVNN